MPELPEVETVARTLRPQVEGRRITSVTILHGKSAQGEAELFTLLPGATVTRVFRRAKILLMEVAPDAKTLAAASCLAQKDNTLPDKGILPLDKPCTLILAFHLKMTGRFFVHPEGTAPLKHTRIIFDLDDGGRLFFDDMRTFGFCRAMRPKDLPCWNFWASLGPEPLEGSAEALAEHLAFAFARRRVAVKAAILNQEIVAGVGNIYADESLFAAGIRPDAPANSLNKKRLLILAKELRRILQKSIDECGSSIRDYRDANGNAGAFQNSFAVYGRKGERCLTCDTPLEATRIAGRGTVFCPKCQK